VVFYTREDNAITIARLFQAQTIGCIYRESHIDLFVQTQIASYGFYHISHAFHVQKQAGENDR